MEHEHVIKCRCGKDTERRGEGCEGGGEKGCLQYTYATEILPDKRAKKREKDAR